MTPIPGDPISSFQTAIGCVRMLGGEGPGFRRSGEEPLGGDEEPALRRLPGGASPERGRFP